MANSLQSQCLIKLGVVTAAIEVSLNAKEQVETVLSAASEANIVSHECIQGQVSLSGRSNIRLLLIGEEGRVISSNHNADFSDKLDSDLINTKSSLIINSNVTDITCQVNGNIVKVSLVIEITVYMLNLSNIELNMADSMCTKKASIQISQMNANTDTSFNVTSEQQVEGSILRVISADSVACLSSTTVNDEILTASGHIYTNFVYMASDNKILIKPVTTAFTEEIKAKDFINNMPISSSVSVRSTKVHIDIMEEGESNKYTLDITLSLKAMQMHPQTKEIISDAYSLTNEVALIYHSVESSLCNDTIYLNQQIEGIVDFNEDHRVIGFVNPKVQIINSVCIEETMLIEGIISGNIISTNSDGNIVSDEYQLPMSIKLSNMLITASVVMPTAIICDVKHHLSAGKIQLTCNIMLNINSYATTINSLISEVKVLEAKNMNTSAIEVCMARKGDTLWDIAKSLSVEESIVTTYNPELVLPLDKDEKIVLYRQIN